jgi:hypothetical protein
MVNCDGHFKAWPELVIYRLCYSQLIDQAIAAINRGTSELYKQ